MHDRFATPLTMSLQEFQSTPHWPVLLKEAEDEKRDKDQKKQEATERRVASGKKKSGPSAGHKRKTTA